MGQPWWGNPYVMPGLPAPRREMPAAGALAALLERDGADGASAPAGAAALAPPAAAAGPEPGSAAMPTSWRSPTARVATGPPTGPPAVWGANFPVAHDRGQSMAGPAVLIRASRKFPCDGSVAHAFRAFDPLTFLTFQ